MTDIQQGLTPATPGDAGGPSRAQWTGAITCAVLTFLSALALRSVVALDGWIHGGSEHWPFARYWEALIPPPALLLIPLAGALVGAAVGFVVWRTRPVRASGPWFVVSRGLLGGATALALFALTAAALGAIGGFSFVPSNMGRRGPKTGTDVVLEGLTCMLFFLVFFGAQVFAVGSITGAVVARSGRDRER